ncbi:transcription factor LHW-like isoform X2 [Phalaenopsis equestris]|uniref:transcription factor LHW-like isoform X2 n=1 Tax=Phalaenopsis equestris TaxID=78828 RepID=UPI0009E2E931|nr:transcription factor LHW-like isoform X2 [Phalaenopsis equestris]
MVGQAASIGNHKWILRDVAIGREPIYSHSSELRNQFLSGIQTIVIIPLLPHGVVQFGSILRVMENNLFINHVKSSFMRLVCEPGSYVSVQEDLYRSGLQPSSFSSAVSDYQFQDDCSNIDRSLSVRCNRQLSISSFSKSLSQASSLSTGCHENLSKIDAERLLNKKIVSSSFRPVAVSCRPMIHSTGNSALHLNKRLENGLVGAHVISHRDILSAANGTCTTDNASFKGVNFPFVCGSRNQEPAIGIKASAENMFGDLDMYSLHPNSATSESANGYGKFTSAAACTKEDIQSLQGMTRSINTSNGNEGIPMSHGLKDSIINNCQGMPSSRHLNQKHDLPAPHGFSSRPCSSTIRASLGTESANSYLNPIQNDESLQSRGIEIDSTPFLLPNEKSSLFLPLATSGDDLFDVLGIYGSLDRGFADQQLAVDVTSCNTKVNHPPMAYSLNNDLSRADIFSESNTDQLLDAVVSKINPAAKRCFDENTSYKTSTTKVSGSSVFCSSLSNDGSASSGKKHEGYISPSLLTSNAETAASTPVRSGDSMDDTERSGCYRSQICLWAESGQNMKSDKLYDSHAERVDEINKVNRKRPRPGETPRPRPKDRQLIMDRVKELREIVPNGAKCSIDALLEKTIKHMLFLQSVAKHADKLRDSGEPKIISKDGVVLLKDNFQGGATWAFEVGSQPMTCPIIVEDLNPPREMLVEMLCEERGVFLEIADLIRGLGLTILKGVMEARKNKVWARFAVEANRDVTRMEIFLSLVRSLEPVHNSSYPVYNCNMPNKLI